MAWAQDLVNPGARPRSGRHPWALWGQRANKTGLLDELERIFAARPRRRALAKAFWLTRQGQEELSKGRWFSARQSLAEALEVKKDYYPAHAAWGACLRNMAQASGLPGLLLDAQEFFANLPPSMDLLGCPLRLDCAGATIYAEWSTLCLMLGDHQHARGHLERALRCHNRAMEQGPQMRAFLIESGCTLDPEFQDSIQWALASLNH